MAWRLAQILGWASVLSFSNLPSLAMVVLLLREALFGVSLAPMAFMPAFP